MGKRKRVKIQVQEVEDSEAGGDADDVQLPTPKVPVGPEATVDSSEESSDDSDSDGEEVDGLRGADAAAAVKSAPGKDVSGNSPNSVPGFPCASMDCAC